jgi:hypothetical protein
MTEDEAYRQMSEDELISKKESGTPGTHVYKMALKELLRRQKEKDEDNKKEQKEVKEDQRQIKKMTAAILALTIILLLYAIAQYFFK